MWSENKLMFAQFGDNNDVTYCSAKMEDMVFICLQSGYVENNG